MNDLKPVAWHTEDHTADYSATTYDKELAERWAKKGWPLNPMYYAIPDTHRVVSVKMLKEVASSIYTHHKIRKQLRDIIDKEQS